MDSGFRWLIVGELVIGAVALGWAVQSGAPIPYGLDGTTFLSALGWTIVLAGTNFALFHFGRRFQATQPIYAFFEEDIFPMVRQAHVVDLLVVAALAGIAEELMFRGMLQPRMGLVASSVLFGMLHGPELKLWPLAAWATLVSIGFGLMYRQSENLALPVLVHGAYDALALLLIRRTR